MTVQKPAQSGVWNLSAFMLWSLSEKTETNFASRCVKEPPRFSGSNWPPSLDRNYPNHYAQIIGGVDDDGFVRVGKKRGNFFYYWKFGLDLRDRETYEKLYGTTPGNSQTASSRPLTELLSSNADIWEFSKDERTLILRHWESQLRQDWIDELVVRAQGYQDELEKLETVRSECNRRLLEKVDVIGLTTTGLARYAHLLDRVKAKTLICEEAGEVLEVSAFIRTMT